MGTINIQGQKFGKLLVLEQTEKPANIKGRYTYWRCKCDCGNEIVVRGSNLRNGNTKSCGCLQKEITSNIFSKDITNQKFGKLIALYPIEKLDSNKHKIWHCKCECGNECDINISNLTQGLTKSCGCNWHNSYGVQKIKELLSSFSLPYEVEKLERINNINYYWDFIINPNSQNYWIIEFDGKQHFQSGSEFGWNTKEHLKQVHQRDIIKNNFAFDNNIPLIRIPYNEENNITIEDLDPHTSRYIVTKYNIEDYYKSNGYEE